MSKTTEIVDLAAEQTSPKYGVCYASGSTFKPTGKGATTFVVESGKRRLVSRTLCVTQYFKSRCQHCPFSQGELTLVATGAAGG
jgi:hypothetical protein